MVLSPTPPSFTHTQVTRKVLLTRIISTMWPCLPIPHTSTLAQAPGPLPQWPLPGPPLAFGNMAEWHSCSAHHLSLSYLTILVKAWQYLCDSPPLTSPHSTQLFFWVLLFHLDYSSRRCLHGRPQKSFRSVFKCHLIHMASSDQLLRRGALSPSLFPHLSYFSRSEMSKLFLQGPEPIFSAILSLHNYSTLFL